MQFSRPRPHMEIIFIIKYLLYRYMCVLWQIAFHLFNTDAYHRDRNPNIPELCIPGTPLRFQNTICITYNNLLFYLEKNKINNIYILNWNLKSHNSDLEMSNCVGFLSSIHWQMLNVNFTWRAHLFFNWFFILMKR